MGTYLSGSGYFSHKLLQPLQAAPALREAIDDVGSTILTLINTLRRRRRRKVPESSPTLRFESTSPLADVRAEPSLDTELDDRGSAGIELAQHLVELQTSAARQLDAADYSLARLRLDLTTVAPNLLDGLPDWAADQLVPAEEIFSADQSQRALVHRDLAA